MPPLPGEGEAKIVDEPFGLGIGRQPLAEQLLGARGFSRSHLEDSEVVQGDEILRIARENRRQ